MTKRDLGLCGGADFCCEIGGSLDITFQRVYGGFPPSRRILTTNTFVLAVDLSPLILGHILILPKQHYLSFAHVITRHETELRQVIDWLLPRYRNTFGFPVILEHGSTWNDDRNSCITHAHWHVLPLDGQRVDDEMQADGLIREPLSDLSQLGESPWIEMSYFLSLHSNFFNIYRPLPAMPRQYIRSVVGRLLGMQDPEWDRRRSQHGNALGHSVAMPHDIAKATEAVKPTWKNSTMTDCS